MTGRPDRLFQCGLVVLAALWIATLGLLACTENAFSSEADAGASIGEETLPERWPHGQEGCESAADFFVHAYNADFFIFRQSGCSNYEKPFLYLLFGDRRAILFDTGASPIRTRKTVETIIATWLKRRKRGRDSLELIVTHTHSHPDHVGGDLHFTRKPNTTLVSARLASVQRFFKLSDWPNGVATYDLGNRKIDIVPIPGHDRAHIAVYDRRTGILLTGDTVYPGRIYIDGSRDDLLASLKRLIGFVRNKRVTHVLGGHIEQRRQSFADYPIRMRFQPEERRLELSVSHIRDMVTALESNPGKLPIKLPDLTLCPGWPRC